MASPLTARSRGQDALRTALTPTRPELRRALASLADHLEAAEWGARRVAATRDPAFAQILGGFVAAERADARAALGTLRSLDPQFARALMRLLLRREPQSSWRALAEQAGLLQCALLRVVRRTSAAGNPSVGGQRGPQDEHTPSLEKT